jgi:hypothetical protein
VNEKSFRFETEAIICNLFKTDGKVQDCGGRNWLYVKIRVPLDDLAWFSQTTKEKSEKSPQFNKTIAKVSASDFFVGYSISAAVSAVLTPTPTSYLAALLPWAGGIFSQLLVSVCVCLPYCHSIAPADTAGMLVLAFLFGACLADGLWLDDGPRAVVHWENPAAAGTTQKKKRKARRFRKSFALYKTNGGIYSAAALYVVATEKRMKKDTEPRYMYIHTYTSIHSI